MTPAHATLLGLLLLGCNPSAGSAPASPRAVQEAPVSSYRKPSDGELRKRLTPEQYDVTQRDGTERPFRNKYWDHHEAGLYVDVVSGEPLFSSRDKFESG